MFNGLIKELAKVQNFAHNELSLLASHKPNLGESIAVNGACLSVIKVLKNGFVVELSKETRDNIAVENLKNFVHIEPAMRLMERIDGHLMQGHIDGVGEILSIEKNENGVDFWVKIPPNLCKFIAAKGSVGIDGVSLTVNEIAQEKMRLTIIPITFKTSLFHTYKAKRRVNIETDLFAKYTARMLEFMDISSKNSSQSKDLSWEQVEKIAYLY